MHEVHLGDGHVQVGGTTFRTGSWLSLRKGTFLRTFQITEYPLSLVSSGNLSAFPRFRQRAESAERLVKPLSRWRVFSVMTDIDKYHAWWR